MLGRGGGQFGGPRKRVCECVGVCGWGGEEEGGTYVPPCSSLVPEVPSSSKSSKASEVPAPAIEEDNEVELFKEGSGSSSMGSSPSESDGAGLGRTRGFGGTFSAKRRKCSPAGSDIAVNVTGSPVSSCGVVLGSCWCP